ELNKSFSEDVKQRFESYGWNHILVKDGNNLEEIDNAITKAKQQNGPTLIEVKTIIGYGAPNVSGTNGVHGAPLGTDERKLTFEAYGLDPEKRFNVPEEVYEIFQTTMLKRANEHEDEWKEKLETYTEKYPELAEEFKLAI
ncbi:MAG: transketolase, partial [Staphylococcus saprophyticus]|nr:transketolase [Staphylococcus saprophyticus]